MFVYHFVDPKGLRYYHICALMVKENFMRHLSAFLLFFGDKKESLVKALYTFREIICYRCEPYEK